MVTFMTFQGLPEYLCLSPALHHPLAFSDYLAEQVAPSPILLPLFWWVWGGNYSALKLD